MAALHTRRRAKVSCFHDVVLLWEQIPGEALWSPFYNEEVEA